MTSAPTSAAYPSPPVASPPVTVACDPISAMRPLEPAVVHGDRGALSGLSRRADAEDLVTEEVLLADNSEAKALERLLHLLERLANQVVGDLCHRRSLRDRDADRPARRNDRPGSGRLRHDDALRLVARHVRRLQVDVVCARPLLDRADVLPGQGG